VTMTTDYPWNGKVAITLNPEKKTRFALRLRVPAWAGRKSDPDDIYHFPDTVSGQVSATVNADAAPATTDRGYLVIDREWAKGDVVEFTLPMVVERITARKEVAADRDRVAIQRGPLVYCVEGADNDGRAWNIVLPNDSPLSVIPWDVAGEHVMAVQAGMDAVGPTADGTGIRVNRKTVTAIPYYTWANRGGNEMQVWLPTKINTITINR